MAFTTVPFTGPLVSDTLNFGFCSASPTKAFIIYTGWTGPAVNQGTRKVFVQAVYFSGKSAPTFGPACAVANMAYTGNLFPNIVQLADGRLLASIADTSGLFSYYVFDVNGSDQVSFSFKSGASVVVGSQQGAFYGAPLALLSGNKIISGNVPAGSNTLQNVFQIVDVGASTLTLSSVICGPFQVVDRSGNSRRNPLYHNLTMFRRDRTGKLMAIRSSVGTGYVISSQSYQPLGYGFSSFDDQGVPQFYACDDGLTLTAASGSVGFHDDSGMQKARDMLPVSPNSVLSLGCTGSNGQAAISGRSNFCKLTIGQQVGTENNAITTTLETPWRDAGKVQFLDVIWLDADYFFALARVSISANDDTIGPNLWNSGATYARDQMAYIGKYNDATGSITLGDASPLALPPRCHFNQPGGQFLHKISNVEVAILGVAQLEGNTNSPNWELTVTVVGA